MLLKSDPEMNVLVIEDDSLDFHHVKKLLEFAFPEQKIYCDHLSNADGVTFFDLLVQYDICILDQNLGLRSGLDVLRDLKQSGCLTPIILLTGDDDADTDIAAAKLGASDFLVKGLLTPKMLSRSVRYSIARAEHEKALVLQANHDFVTGLPNKQHIEAYLKAAVDAHGRHHEDLAVAVINIDSFEQVNAAHGIAAGNQVLKEVGARLKAKARKTDFLGRYTADEFVMVFEMTEESDNSTILASFVSDCFGAPILLGNKDIYCTASVGLAVKAAGDSSLNSEALLEAASRDLASKATK